MSRLRSLRARLLLAGMAGVLMAALLGAWLLGAGFERAVGAAFDRRLGDELAALIAAATLDAGGRIALRTVPADPRYRRVFSGAYWRIGEGTDALQSRSLWDAALAPALDVDARMRLARVDGPAQQSLRIAAQRVRLPGAAAAVPFVVGRDEIEVHTEVRQFRVFAGLSIGAIALLLMLAMVMQVGFGLRPLTAVGRGLASIRRGEADGFDAATLPREVQPLAHQINELLDQHRRQVRRARHAADDLAHALKSPLAVLAAEAAQAQAVASTVVAAEVARLQSLIARRLAAPAPDPRARTPVAPVAAALVALFSKLHAERALDLESEIAADATFPGTRDDLEELLGNLVDNACKWSRARVRIAARREGERLRLIVDDDGAGLPADQYERVLQRGVRLDERMPGSGHGLSIVDGIAEAYGGTLSLASSPLGGLRAALDLPAPPR
jgi:signal transduction histidine kinase